MSFRVRRPWDVSDGEVKMCFYVYKYWFIHPSIIMTSYHGMPQVKVQTVGEWCIGSQVQWLGQRLTPDVTSANIGP